MFVKTKKLARLIHEGENCKYDWSICSEYKGGECFQLAREIKNGTLNSWKETVGSMLKELDFALGNPGVDSDRSFNIWWSGQLAQVTKLRLASDSVKKYTSKDIEVDAVQWTSDIDIWDMVKLIDDRGFTVGVHQVFGKSEVISVTGEDSEYPLYIEQGDWIIFRDGRVDAQTPEEFEKMFTKMTLNAYNYRMKQVYAVQWERGLSAEKLMDLLNQHKVEAKYFPGNCAYPDEIEIHTPNGIGSVTEGDWIVFVGDGLVDVFYSTEEFEKRVEAVESI